MKKVILKFELLGDDESVIFEHRLCLRPSDCIADPTDVYGRIAMHFAHEAWNHALLNGHLDEYAKRTDPGYKPPSG